MRPGAAMIFAAGFGTRMGELVRDRPKALLELGGRTLLDHAIDRVRAAAPGMRIVVNAHHHAPLIEAHLAGRGIAVSREEPSPLETGGGLRRALPLLGPGPVLTLNPDALFTGANPVAELLDGWDAGRMEGLLLLVRPEDRIGREGPGDFTLDAAGRISRGGPLTYAGIGILRTEGLAEIAEKAFSLNRLWDAMAARGGLFGQLHRGRWIDVGTAEAFRRAEARLAAAGGWGHAAADGEDSSRTSPGG